MTYVKFINLSIEANGIKSPDTYIVVIFYNNISSIIVDKGKFIIRVRETLRTDNFQLDTLTLPMGEEQAKLTCDRLTECIDSGKSLNIMITPPL